MTPDGDSHACITPTTCTTEQIIKTDGTCDDCTGGQIPDVDKKTCITATCAAREINTNSGCEACGDYLTPDAAKTACITPSCATR